MIPSWYQLLQRIWLIWKLRRKKFAFCRSCETPLTEDSSERGGWCIECTELHKVGQVSTVWSIDLNDLKMWETKPPNQQLNILSQQLSVQQHLMSQGLDKPAGIETYLGGILSSFSLLNNSKRRH